MKKPSQNHPKAHAEFFQSAGSIEGCIARLMVISAIDFGTKGKNVDWGDVGSLGSAKAKIAEGMTVAEELTGSAIAATVLTDEELKFVDNTIAYITAYSEDSACHIDGKTAQFFIRSALIAAVISGRK